MSETQPDEVTTYLAEVRERSERPLPHVTSLPIGHDGVRALMESAADVPPLLAAVDSLRDQRRTYEDLLGSIWLYIPWYFVTKQLTAPQKELFADAVDAHSRRLNEEDPDLAAGRADRWWRDAARG